MKDWNYYINLIESGENEMVEFKASYDKENILKSVGAFANKDGGIILIGITDDGKVKGYKGKETLKKIADDINGAIEPSLNISVKEIKLKDKKITIIEIPPAPIKPVSVKGRYYIRIGSTNRLMNINEICDMYALSTSKSWDVQIYENISLKNLNIDNVKKYMKILEERRKIPIKETPIEFLRKKLYIRGEKITNAAVILFVDNPQIFFPSRMVQIIVYRNDRSNIQFQEEIKGSIFEMIEDSYKEVLKILSTRLEIIEIVNVQRYSIPEKALREGIINALVHRDWSIPSPVYIEISSKGVTITNPGVIPPPLTPELLKEADHYSILRNPKISEALYEAGYIERYGSGATRIINSYENKSVKPEWWIKAGRTYLYLPLIQLDIENSIIKLVKIKGKITANDVSKEIGISLNTARKYLKKLVDKKILKMEGKTKGRYYKLKK